VNWYICVKVPSLPRGPHLSCTYTVFFFLRSPAMLPKGLWLPSLGPLPHRLAGLSRTGEVAAEPLTRAGEAAV
jgi:hypothetical protein